MGVNQAVKKSSEEEKRSGKSERIGTIEFVMATAGNKMAAVGDH